MLKAIRYALALIAVSSFLSACARDTVDSSTVAGTPSGGGHLTDNIDRSYLLTASEDSPNVSFIGEFTMAGTWNTTIRLSDPAMLVVDGHRVTDAQTVTKETATLVGALFPIFSPLLWAASGTHYFTNVSGTAAHVVQWTDQLGKVFTDSLMIYPIQTVSVPSLVSRSGGLTVQVTAGPAPGDNRYSAEIVQRRADGASAVATASSTTGQIVFSAQDLNELQPGSATITVERTVTTDLNSQGSGEGRAFLTYKTRAQNVSVN